MRKPRLKTRFPGEYQFRNADRQLPAVLPQPPPRSTRTEPFSGPCGSVPPVKVSAYKSRHHSHTLPCMSDSPHRFVFFWPT